VRHWSLQLQINQIWNLSAFPGRAANVLLRPLFLGQVLLFRLSEPLLMKLARYHLNQSNPQSGPCPRRVLSLVQKELLYPPLTPQMPLHLQQAVLLNLLSIRLLRPPRDMKRRIQLELSNEIFERPFKERLIRTRQSHMFNPHLDLA
jgi:hypothetical protein